MLAGDRDGAAAALSDELDRRDGAIATTPAGLDDRLAALEAAGVNTLVAVPLRATGRRLVRALAAAEALGG